MSIKKTIFTILVIPLFASKSLCYAEPIRGWYQVDLILFKPTNANLGNENWLEFEQSYPSDVLAITEPRVFNLSQLEGIDSFSDHKSKEPLQTWIDPDQFLFAPEGNNNRNLRILESLANEREQAKPEINETKELLASKENPGVISDSRETIDSTTEEIVLTSQQSDNLPNEPTFSAGKLAYSRTTEKSSLKSILRNLNWSSSFQVLSHDSWVQPINTEPTLILMQSGKRYDNRYEVEGTLSFTRSRYLHVQTDLWYTRFEESTNNLTAPREVVASALSEEVLNQYRDLVKIETERGQFIPISTHLMKQSRRIRSSELHYIDHPLFGMIIRISQYEHEVYAET